MVRIRKKTIAVMAALAMLAVLAGFVIHYFSSVYEGLDSLSKEPEDSPFHLVQRDAPKELEPPKWTGTEPVNVLLLGVDARGLKTGESARSDSMVVVSLDPVRKKLRLFSILRDTYTDIPGYKSNRINTAVTHGPDVAMQAVSGLLGIPVQYYIYTDFQGFIALVDAVGGVDFEVEKDLVYTTIADGPEYDINLKKGYQHLDGNKALQYVRFRHDAMSDFTRTERQRELLKAVADKMKSTTSILKLPAILEEVSPYIDTNLTVTDMWKLASTAYQSTVADSEQIPPMNMLEQTYVGRAAVLKVSDETKLKTYIQEIMADVPAEPSQSEQ